MTTVPQKVYDIYYDEASQFVVMNWNGYATSDEFREGTMIMLEILMRHKATKVLGNIKDMTIIGADDQRWLETQFLPQAISHGFEALALITPKSYFNKVAVETVSYTVDKEKLRINFFDTLEEATEWLLSWNNDKL